MKDLPVAVCTVCGGFSHELRMINRRCNLLVDGKPCRGVFSGAYDPADWASCPACLGLGVTDGKPCERCHSAGAIFIRGQPRPSA